MPTTHTPNWEDQITLRRQAAGADPIFGAVSAFNIGDYDRIDLGYDGSSNLTSVTYYKGGVQIGLLNLTYTGSNITRIAKG